MMEDVLNDESENISLSQLLDIPTQQLILEEVQHNSRFSAREIAFDHPMPF
jgi:hypothetical protein